MRRIDKKVVHRPPMWDAPTRTASVLPVLLLLLSCGEASLESKVLDRPITVDGKSEDWRDSLTYFKDAGIAVGAFNDQKDLYVCVTSWNQEISLEAMNQGLTVWFSPGGAAEKRFGVEYPLLQDRLGHDRPGPKEQADPLFAEQGTVSHVALRGPGADDRRILAVPDVPGLEVTAAAVTPPARPWTSRSKPPASRPCARPAETRGGRGAVEWEAAAEEARGGEWGVAGAAVWGMAPRGAGRTMPRPARACRGFPSRCGSC